VTDHQGLLKYLMTTKMGAKGQLTVPKQFREELGLGTGAPFAVLRMGDGLILLPEQQRFDRLCEQIGSALTTAGVEQKAILATLPKTRRRIFECHYGATSLATPPSRRQSRRRRET
jgi:AbrB family looped-hinge helix DNA binding protein